MKKEHTIRVQIEFFPEGSVIVAYAKELDVASCGNTQNEAMDAVLEALRLFLTVSHERGTLDQILIESGFVLHGNLWHLPNEQINEGWTPDNIIPPEQITRQLACVEV